MVNGKWAFIDFHRKFRRCCPFLAMKLVFVFFFKVLNFGLCKDFREGKKTNTWILFQIMPHCSLGLPNQSSLTLDILWEEPIHSDCDYRTVEGKIGWGWPETKWMDTVFRIKNQPVRRPIIQMENSIFRGNAIHLVASHQNILMCVCVRCSPGCFAV